MSTDPMIEVFVYENMQLLEQLEDMLLSGEEKNAKLSREQVDEVFRVMHTIKGSSGMMSFDSMAKLAHSLEDLFSKIREKEPPETKWEGIFDILLETIDFFKVEIDKIQEGQNPDGNIDQLHDKIKSELDGLYNAAAVKSSQAIRMPGDEDQAENNEKSSDIDAQAGSLDDELSKIEEGNESMAMADDLKCYMAKLMFQPGCGMESVRAFGVVNSLKGLFARIAHVPENIESNCDEEIAVNGFVIYVMTDEPEDIKLKINETVLLDSFEFSEIDVDESPFAEEKKAQAKEKPSERGAAAGQPEDSKQAMKSKEKASAAEKAPKQNFISVNVGKIDKLMNLVGEIVTTESMVTKNPDIVNLHLENFEKQARQLRKLTDELQDVVMSIRMVPISSTFHKMLRIVRDMSKKINKEARLEIIGEQTEVDKNVIDNLSDPLMHLIRNCMDHGLETPEERIAAGKDPVGTITLEARNAGGDVIVTVSDDGQGLDRHSIIEKAIERGVTHKTEAEISDKEAYSFIMAPGFSTNEVVTEFSGRGVGMDVVHKNMENIGGTVTIESEKGKGMSVIMHIPLTLAIVDGMRVVVGDNHFIVPILNIRESFEPGQYEKIVNPDGGEVIIIRGNVYKVVRLYEIFGLETEVTSLDEGIMLMLESESGVVCLFVDKLVGEQQAVIKPVPSYITRYMGRIKGLAGCTILGDGSISLILDINTLLS